MWPRLLQPIHDLPNIMKRSGVAGAGLPNDTLTLISDGILEAQKPNGELFGFDRIVKHLASSNSASSLATAAQDFGQEDDITVLTISRVGLAV